jgi:glycerate dehydrogenase
MHHTIVALESIHMPIPEFAAPPGVTAKQIVHDYTTDAELAARIRDATIVVVTTRRLTAALLDPAATPRLQLVAQMATGTDNIDLAACRRRGVRVCNTPHGNVESVATHAMALYFAARRAVPLMHWRTVRDGEWKARGSITGYMRDPTGRPPPTCAEEVCGIVGFGHIGASPARRPLP